MQDCSNSIANALELLQSCTKPSKWFFLWGRLMLILMLSQTYQLSKLHSFRVKNVATASCYFCCAMFWCSLSYACTQLRVSSFCIDDGMEQEALMPVPLMVFQSNSKCDQNLLCSSLKCALLITTKFCTRHDSYTVVTCAQLRCDRLSTFETRAFQILIKFRLMAVAGILY